MEKAKEFYKAFFFAAGVIISVAFFFISSSPAKAEKIYDIQHFPPYSYHTYTGDWDIVGQNFIPNSDIITGIEFVPNQSGTLILHLCYGAITNDNAHNLLDNCLHAAATTTCSLYYHGTTTCYFDKSYILNQGQPYHFVFEHPAGYKVSLEFDQSSSDGYPDGDMIFGNYGSEQVGHTLDLLFTTFYDNDVAYNDYDSVEIIEPPDWQETVEIISDDTITYDRNIYCTLNETCYIWVNWYDNLDNDRLYLTDEDDKFNTSSAYDTIYINDTALGEDYFSVSSPTTAGDKNYCIYHEKEGMGPYNDNVYCGITIHWTSDEPFETVLDKFFSDYNCETICDGIATGTDWFNFRYGIECGFRKILCWGFVPSDESLTKFAKSIYHIKNSFPFSIYTQVEQEVQHITISTSTQTFILNWHNLLGTGPDQDLVLASSTILLDDPDFSPLWKKIYNIMEQIVYLSVFIYIVWRIIKLAKRE